MTTQQHPADVPSSAHIARATSFIASLFLGVGKFDKIEDLKTIEEARKAVEDLRLRNPLSTRKPMVYAVLPEGKAEWIDHTAPLPDDGDDPTEAEAEAGQADEARHCAPPMAETINAQPKETETMKTYSDRSNCRKAAMKAGIKPDDIEIIKKGERFAFRSKAVKIADLAKSDHPAAKANAASWDKKNGGPVKAAKPKAAPKPAKKTAEAKPPAGKRAAIMDAAKAGKLPSPPDFSAETHKRFRAKLESLVAMAKAGDIKGLKAVEINPVSSSPKAMAKYRDLAVIALEAKAAR